MLFYAVLVYNTGFKLGDSVFNIVKMLCRLPSMFTILITLS